MFIIKPYICKEFNKYGIVRLPVKWRKEFNFTQGKAVDLVYQSDAIIVRSHKSDSTDNTRVISDEGTIRIPVELKRLMGLTPEDEVCIFIDKENKCFIIKTM